MPDIAAEAHEARVAKRGSARVGPRPKREIPPEAVKFLARLRVLSPQIRKTDALAAKLYRERLRIYHDLRGMGVTVAVIAKAAGTTEEAVFARCRHPRPKDEPKGPES